MLLLSVLTLMFLANPAPYRQGFVRLFPSFYRQRIEEVLYRCEECLQGWLTGILFKMIVVGILSFLGLLILGIPLALAQAILAGILTFVPYIGPVLSMVPPIAIALIEQPWKALVVIIFYIVIEQVTNKFLTSLVIETKLLLLPAVTLLAQVFFATFFGFLGLFLALPLTIIAQVCLQEILIKDILDRWQIQPEEKNLSVTVMGQLYPISSENQPKPVMESSEETAAKSVENDD